MVAPVEQQEVEQQQETAPGTEPGPSLHNLVEQLRIRAYELGAYAKYYLSLKLDGYRLSIKRAVLYGAVGLGALVVFGSAVIASAVLLMLGLAGLIGEIWDNFWLGATILGGLVLILAAIGAWITIAVARSKMNSHLQKKYADLRQRQKEAFGRNIEEVAHAR